MQTIVVSHPVTDPEIAQIHALLKLKEEIQACEDLIATAEASVGGMQIIPQHDVEAARAELETLRGKLEKALKGSSNIVRERYYGTVPYLPAE